jgi:hypothetical protein
VLDERELVAARSDAAGILTGTCTRLARGRVDDGQGGRTNAYTPAGTYVCRLEVNGRDPHEANVAGAARSVTRWVLLLPLEAAGAFVADDRVAAEGLTFHVTGVYGAGTLELLGRLELELVEGA